MRWWFILRGDENTLKMLEGDWECIQILTGNWNIVPPLLLTTIILQQLSKSPENSSTTNSDTIMCPGMTVGTNPNQACNTQTVIVDVNSSSLTDSQDKPDDAVQLEPQQSSAASFFFFFYSRWGSNGRNLTLSKGNTCINILYLNTHSILPKLDELHVLCAVNSIVEPQLSRNSNTRFYYFYKRQEQAWWGYCCFCQKFLTLYYLCFETPTLLHSPLEFLPLCIEFCKHNFVSLYLYRSDSLSSHSDAFLQCC